MSINNIAIVFAPNIFRSTDVMKELKYIKTMNDIFKIMLEEKDIIFSESKKKLSKSVSSTLDNK